MRKTISYLGFTVLNETYSDARKSFLSGSVLTISPNSYGLSTVNNRLDEALKREGLLVLDGVYFGLGYFLRTLKTIQKNQGPEIFYHELEIQQKNRGRVFFLGASEQTLARIKERVNNEYPAIHCNTYSPPFKLEFDDKDNEEISRRIETFKPNVVFVGMTCPKQEIWVHQNIHNHKDVLFLAIGGVFDWFAGNRKELHPLWWKLRLGWLGRILQRPEILRRNLKFILIYIKDMFK
jgi:N-acetylglucosaminyldiphosphoundecaprenol N-acetyl-beta-D-mannosaminyltransferase